MVSVISLQRVAPVTTDILKHMTNPMTYVAAKIQVVTIRWERI
jgi:hypothetical protein